ELVPYLHSRNILLCVCFSHFFLFFYCYLDLRCLHSFPTRRSSDLVGRWVDVGPVKLFDVWMSFPAGGKTSAEVWKDPQAKEDFRSEEHMSELQSLRHLVCRLLLEKKKK